MVLQYWDRPRTEEDLAIHLGTTVLGTPGSRLLRLSSPEFQVFFGPLTLPLVRSSLERGRPVIALVRTVFLDYWEEDFAHAVVVAGFDEESLLLNDPAVKDAPQRASVTGFLAAWGEFDYMCGTIAKR